MKEVDGTDPGATTLYSMLDEGSMPPQGRLSDDLLKVVRDWIQKGAPERATEEK
jgi:hypothetical protein